MPDPDNPKSQAEVIFEALLAAGISLPSLPVSTAGPPPTAISAPEIYYEHSATTYWMRNRRGRFIKIPRVDVEAHLREAGFCPAPGKGAVHSEVQEQILTIQHEHDVDFVGSLSGRRKGLQTFGDTRILVTTEPTFIAPQAWDFSMLFGILERMFGPTQLAHLLSWIAVALEMFRRGTWRPGQIMFVAGPPGAGKGLLAALLSLMFGGRMPGKPYRFMTGRVEFNSDFFGSELLTIEDEAESVGIQARRAFGAAIKIMTVNDVQWLHAKGKPALSVIPLWRIFASLNNDLERMQVIPPLEDDIADKVILLLAEKHPMPMPTDTAEQYAAFMKALRGEIPAFLHHLQSWVIPPEIRSSRFGVSHYHHPELAAALQKLSPEDQLIELIDEFIFEPVSFGKPWRGRSTALERQLKDHKDKRCAREAEKILAHNTSCGKYLGRLEKRIPDRVSQRTIQGNAEWTILSPSGGISPYKHPNVTTAFMEKLKNVEAVKEPDAGGNEKSQ